MYFEFFTNLSDTKNETIYKIQLTFRNDATGLHKLKGIDSDNDGGPSIATIYDFSLYN